MSQDTSLDIDTGAITRRLRALSDTTPLSVMLVDDDELERALVADRLSARNFHVVEASDGRHALAELRKQPQPVLLVDWSMPVMDGIEFITRVRALDMQDTFIIMLTARDAEFDFQRGYLAGADDYVSKKVSDVELLARLHTAFAMHSLRQENRRLRAELESLRRSA
jgi:DNA-binding response OmpR family regulator